MCIAFFSVVVIKKKGYIVFQFGILVYKYQPGSVLVAAISLCCYFPRSPGSVPAWTLVPLAILLLLQVWPLVTFHCTLIYAFQFLIAPMTLILACLTSICFIISSKIIAVNPLVSTDLLHGTLFCASLQDRSMLMEDYQGMDLGELVRPFAGIIQERIWVHRQWSSLI